MHTDPPKPMTAKPEAHQSTCRATQTNGKRNPTKADQLVRLLSRKSGADIATLCETFCWQPHTTRAAISRLRKTGKDVMMTPAANGKPARYRIQKMAGNCSAGSSAGKANTHAG